MKMFQKKKKMLTPEQAEEIRIQEFFDRIVPSTVRFLYNENPQFNWGFKKLKAMGRKK